MATIGRILAEAGVTKANARKRPQRAWMRFSRSFPMEMWQNDGLEYRLFDQDGTKATIYQLLDDGTRFDVGARCFARPENRDDAIATLSAAFEECGVPQELLSDNGQVLQPSPPRHHRVDRDILSRARVPGHHRAHLAPTDPKEKRTQPPDPDAVH